MPITVVIHSGRPSEARLTFDGMHRVVIGRGPSCDVRLPDASVSHRHAYLLAEGPDFVLFDEASTNGTFVGSVRIAPRTSRIVRSGDWVRLGRVWLELRIDQGPITRDVAGATRDLALALVSQALAARGKERTTRVRVVEGADQGDTLALDEEARAYVLGRGAHCDLPLSDTDVSREHTRITRRGNLVVVCDLGAKNGTWLGEIRVETNADATWRPAQMMRVGRSVIALEEPVAEALAEIESARDEALLPDDAIDLPAHPPSETAGGPPPTAPIHEMPNPAPVAPIAALPSATRMPRRPTGWSITDLIVVAAAVSMLALSMAGLVWLLR
jgi:pSer/pThr/pTyr-binding forkhead associated (FHA) protein